MFAWIVHVDTRPYILWAADFYEAADAVESLVGPKGPGEVSARRLVEGEPILMELMKARAA